MPCPASSRRRPAAPRVLRPAPAGTARPTARRSPPWLRSALIGCVAAWLLAQTLGHLHAVLHARPAAAALTAAAAPNAGAPAAQAPSLSRAFHPTGDPTQSDGGLLCRLYAQAVQGGLAIGAAPAVAADGGFAVPAAAAPVSADTAPRRGSQARAPPVPAFG